MRLNLAVLVAAITLVSQGIDYSAAHPKDISKMVQGLDTTQSHTGNRLRGGNEYVDDSDDMDKDDDERGGKTFPEKFAKWYARGDSAQDVYDRFALAPVIRKAYKHGHIGDLDNNPNYRKWAGYSAYLKEKGLN